MVIFAGKMPKHIHIRMCFLFYINVAQLPPNVKADDEKNELIGATQYMEYSVNGIGNGNGRWVDYDPKNPPKFEGNQNVFIRHKGEMNLEVGLSEKVTFKKE